jgi:ABC-2 type transport system permease protein
LEEVSPRLAAVAWLNPFSHAVELIRFALYLQFEPIALVVCVLALVIFFGLAIWGYDPGRGFWTRRVAE